jgi:hypothetical protein
MKECVYRYNTYISIFNGYLGVKCQYFIRPLFCWQRVDFFPEMYSKITRLTVPYFQVTCGGIWHCNEDLGDMQYHVVEGYALLKYILIQMGHTLYGILNVDPLTATVLNWKFKCSWRVQRGLFRGLLLLRQSAFHHQRMCNLERYIFTAAFV